MNQCLKFALCCALMFAPVIAKEYSIIGHRGNPCDSPENTLSSFKQAIDLGANYIEFDVHLSKDGIPIVVHDPILGRTTDSNIPFILNTLTLEQIQSYDAGGWFEKSFQGEKIPTLEEVIELTKGKIGLMVEIKTGTASEEKLAQEVLYVIQKARREEKLGPILVGSCSPEVLFSLRQADPTVPIIAIAQTNNDLIQHLKNNPEMFALNEYLVTPEITEALHKDGRGVWVWCVDDACFLNKLIEEGVDGFISNRPKLLMDKIHNESL